MTAMSEQRISPIEGQAINIVDSFSQKLQELKAKKNRAKATRVISLNADPAEDGGASTNLTSALQVDANAKREKRRSARRMPRKTGNSSSTNLEAVKNGVPSLHRSTTDPSLSLASRLEKLKEKSGCTVDPDEMLKKRREAKAQGSGRNGGGASSKRMPRKTGSNGNLVVQGVSGLGLQRSTTAPTISLQARMEKLKLKQQTMATVDPDEMLRKRREGKKLERPSIVFGSAPNLPGMMLASEDREERRRRRSGSRTRKLRISRTTSAGRVTDQGELPTLASYPNGGQTLRRTQTDAGKYAAFVASLTAGECTGSPKKGEESKSSLRRVQTDDGKYAALVKSSSPKKREESESIF